MSLLRYLISVVPKISVSVWRCFQGPKFLRNHLIKSDQINARFVGRCYMTRPGSPTIVNDKHNQKVHSWVVFWMYWYQLTTKHRLVSLLMCEVWYKLQTGQLRMNEPLFCTVYDSAVWRLMSVSTSRPLETRFSPVSVNIWRPWVVIWKFLKCLKLGEQQRTFRNSFAAVYC